METKDTKEYYISPKMKAVIAYLFEVQGEMTPLQLQKLLYYIQGLSFALNGREMFEDDCQAWVHGEVYPNVYQTFKEFSFKFIDDCFIPSLATDKETLAKDDKEVISLVSSTFGNYSAKKLEELSHYETPWIEAREGYKENERSNKIVTKKAIRSYFVDINKFYDLSTEEGINTYIEEKIADNEEDEELSEETIKKIKAYEKAKKEGTLVTYTIEEVMGRFEMAN
jgi:uncharacterized phage-associated protein